MKITKRISSSTRKKKRNEVIGQHPREEERSINVMIKSETAGESYPYKEY